MPPCWKTKADDDPSTDHPQSPSHSGGSREGREQVAEELPELITRHDERLVALDQLADLVQQLKAAREERG
jgi:hypothetical protein